MTATFHLSLPIRNSQQTRNFYCDVLGGNFLEGEANWFQVLLHGHQLTFHETLENRIDKIPFHWGLHTNWQFFHELSTKLQKQQIRFEALPHYQQTGTPEEKVKMLFYDPNGYLLEYKAHKHVSGNSELNTQAKRKKKSFWSLWEGAFPHEACLYK